MNHECRFELLISEGLDHRSAHPFHPTALQQVCESVQYISFSIRYSMVWRTNSVLGERGHFLGLLLLSALASSAVPAAAEETEELQTEELQTEALLALSWEELNAQEISTLTRKRTSLAQSAAAAFVISSEDIRRSGARTIPDVLRMAPGMQVAAMNGWNPGVTVRGMNGLYTNKLLVMVDGRSIYNPFIGGVWWGDQNLFLEDIERIEILRGPSGSLWGANAFNGVVNIVSKRAGDTLGGLAVAGGGNEDRAFGGARYGFRLGEESYLRVFAQALDRDATAAEFTGKNARDGQSAQHGGFRLDSKWSSRDRFTLQGDVFHNQDGWYTRTTRLTPPYNVMGQHTQANLSKNLLGRWQHRQEDGGDWTLGLYIDHTDRHFPALGEEHFTLDLDFQHRLAPWGPHEFMWGAGYRHIRDNFDNTLLISVLPDQYRQHNFSAFLQDEITLLPKLLRLTLGSKFEHYTLAGFQVEPSIRLSWTPHHEHNLWSAVSRAVALPTRFQRDYHLIATESSLPDTDIPVFIGMDGSRDVRVENVIAYELGWRWTPSPRLKFDTALFYNHYRDIITPEAAGVGTVPGLGFPLAHSRLANGRSINGYGLELAAEYAMWQSWRWKLAHTWMGLDENGKNLSAVHPRLRYDGTQPHHTLSLRSGIDLRDDVELDVWLRYAGSVNPAGRALPPYLTLDLRLGWQVSPHLELSLVGRNLLDGHHPEFGNSFYLPIQTELERAVYGKIDLRF